MCAPIPEARNAPRRRAAAIADAKERIRWIVSADGVKPSIAIKWAAQHRDAGSVFVYESLEAGAHTGK